MAHTVHIWLDDFSGTANMKVELYPGTSDAIANGTGGDALIEDGNNKGLFTATVSQDLSGDHHGRVLLSSGIIIATFRVHIGGSTIAIGKSNNVTALLLPAMLQQLDTAPSSTIPLAHNEYGYGITHPVIDQNGDNYDVSEATHLYVCNHDLTQTLQTATLGDGLSVDGHEFTFTPIAAVTANVTTVDKPLHWSLREVTGSMNRELTPGRIVVTPSATAIP